MVCPSFPGGSCCFSIELHFICFMSLRMSMFEMSQKVSLAQVSPPALNTAALEDGTNSCLFHSDHFFITFCTERPSSLGTRKAKYVFTGDLEREGLSCKFTMKSTGFNSPIVHRREWGCRSSRRHGCEDWDICCQ